ncbi:hypothetical protein Q7P37_000680 [Cladosporium fusiforme]
MAYWNPDPLFGRVPLCVYDAECMFMYYTQGNGYDEGWDPNLQLYMYDAHYGAYSTVGMDEVLPRIFVSWNEVPFAQYPHAAQDPYIVGVMDMLSDMVNGTDPYYPPAPRSENRNQRANVNNIPARTASYPQTPRRANSSFRPTAKRDHQSNHASSSRVPDAGRGRAGSSAQVPDRAVSYLVGPPRATSQPPSGRAGSFLGPPGAQRAPSYQQRGQSFLLRSTNANRRTQRNPSHLGIPGQGSVLNSGSRANSYMGSQRASSFRVPGRSGSSLSANVNQSRANSFIAPNAVRPGNQAQPNYRALIHALHNQYRHRLVIAQGRYFDHVDDSVIATYALALGFKWETEVLNRLTIKPKKLADQDRAQSYSIPIPFLGLRHTVLEVFFPLDHDAIADLSNDVLRVLHIRIVNIDNNTIPVPIPDADIVESSRVVAAELRRRGFTERPAFVQFRGLPRAEPAPTDSPATAGEASSSAPVRPNASIFQPAHQSRASRPTVSFQNIASDFGAVTTRYHEDAKGKGKAPAVVDEHSSGSDTASAHRISNPTFSVSAPEEDLYSISDRETAEHVENVDDVRDPKSDDDSDEHKGSAENGIA